MCHTVTDSPKWQSTNNKRKGKVTSRVLFRKTLLAMKDEIRRIEILLNLSLLDRFENFRKNKVNVKTTVEVEKGLSFSL